MTARDCDIDLGADTVTDFYRLELDSRTAKVEIRQEGSDRSHWKLTDQDTVTNSEPYKTPHQALNAAVARFCRAP